QPIPNQNALVKQGGNLYSINAAATGGAALAAPTAGTTIKSGSLELSNVDLAKEFADLITTQRGFQANARVITTSDDIMQELVSLKR
ncbi:MAG TPA: flagellar basal body rod C-terminal domain-containing protein, partial [Verrucomicrobiae bacterium]|nr:flagellar basal body rod C-terminal domain-containing protein [Verrucomicrobiae bacterium]